MLCECGLGTRSEVKKLIKKSKITVNGIDVNKADFKVDETKDVVVVNGKTISYEKYQYLLFHKPMNCVTAKKDNIHKTVMDFMPKDLKEDCSPVGRLDLDTEGLLLITNDGELNHRLMSPSHHVDKTYYVKVDEKIPDNAVELFEKGLDIGDDKLTLPARLVVLDDERKEANITICEGRFHQVKRMFEAVGCKVIYLKRISMGKLTLEDLKLGEYRYLTSEEIKEIKND